VAAQRWAQTHCPPEVPRAVAEAEGAVGTAPDDGLPAVWEKMAAQGWLGLHLSEADGGQGFTLAELAVVVEELGYALLPGPLLPTLLVSAALARHHDGEVRARLLPGLADGTITAAVALGAGPLTSAPAGNESGALTLSGVVRPVLGTTEARLVLVPVGGADGSRWLLLDRESAAVPAGQPLSGIDGTRAVWSLDLSGGLEVAA